MNLKAKIASACSLCSNNGVIYGYYYYYYYAITMITVNNDNNKYYPFSNNKNGESIQLCINLKINIA